MKKNIVLVILVFFVLSCTSKTKTKSVIGTNKVIKDTISNNKETFKSIFDLKETIKRIKKVEHTKDKYKDWMFNRVRTLRSSLEIEHDKFKVKSTSYTYKDSFVFYLHNILHTNNSISIKPFIEKLQGKITKGYTQERLLIFAMKNDKEANFIDIPPNYGHSKLRTELIKEIYNSIDFDVITCDTIKPCVYKDLRK